MDDETKESIINSYLSAFTPKERECTICGTKYIGSKIICESKRCFWGLQARIADNRSRRPLDYDSRGRKPLLIMEYPNCKICDKEYFNSLEEHCKEINDEAHLVLLVHNG